MSAHRSKPTYIWFLFLAGIVNAYGGDSVIVADWRSNDFVIFAPLGGTTEMRIALTGADTTLRAADTIAASRIISSYCATQLDSLRSVPRAILK